MPASAAVAATSALPIESATTLATTAQLPHARQEVRQHEPPRRPPRRADPPPSADASACTERALESAALTTAGRATVQATAVRAACNLGSGDECASASNAGPGTIATTVRSPPDRSTARP
jgi:hypothetical protein